MQVAPVVAALEASVLRYVADAASASVPLAPHRHRDAFVTMTAHGLLLAGCTATKRDVYYMAKALFGRQANADAAVARVAAAVPCHRNDLNIVAASKSIVAGDLRFATEDGHTVDVGLFGPAGVLVPARPERLTAVQTRAEFILVVEKETVFATLAGFPNFLDASKCILLTGKGYPDHAARLLLAAISAVRPALPVLVLTDADPHGLHIALTYYDALPIPAAFHYIGVRPSERETLLAGLEEHVFLPLREAETVLARNLVSATAVPQAGRPSGGVGPVVQELKYVLSTGAKFEMEALMTLESSAETLVNYVNLKVRQLGTWF